MKFKSIKSNLSNCYVSEHEVVISANKPEIMDIQEALEILDRYAKIATDKIVETTQYYPQDTDIYQFDFEIVGNEVVVKVKSGMIG